MFFTKIARAVTLQRRSPRHKFATSSLTRSSCATRPQSFCPRRQSLVIRAQEKMCKIKSHHLTMAVDRISPNARGCVLGWVRLWTSYVSPSVSLGVTHDLLLDLCESAQLQRGTSLLCCVSSPKVCGCDVADVQHVPCQSEVPSPAAMSGVVSFTESERAGSIGIPPGILIPRRLFGRKRNASAATKARTTRSPLQDRRACKTRDLLSRTMFEFNTLARRSEREVRERVGLTGGRGKRPCAFPCSPGTARDTRDTRATRWKPSGFESPSLSSHTVQSFSLVPLVHFRGMFHPSTLQGRYYVRHGLVVLLCG